MRSDVEVVIVGGGIVGCSVQFALARLGCTDTLLLEKNELTSGSTWHAAGNVTFFGHYSSITGLYVNSVRAYLEAAGISGQDVGFHPAGSLRLAVNETELEAYRSLVPMYEQLQVAYEIVSPSRIAELHPLLDVNDICGAAYTPGDGHVDASGATFALAGASRKLGAEIKRQCEVSEIRREAGAWVIETPSGVVRARKVVLAASFWTRELVESLGLRLPLYALEHHEIVTDDIAQLAELGFEVPTVRDPWSQSNTRQEGNGLLCGVYEPEPRFWAVDGIPPDFNQQLLPPDLDRLEGNLEKVFKRLPAFADAGIKVVNNGPICYTPDGCPLLGPVSGFEELWLASGFAVGIGTGGGSGEFLAHWMANGAPPYELPIVYPSRFGREMSRPECMDAIRKTYAAGYVSPRDSSESG